MFKNKKILAVIPARGGSKGVPNKNIRPLAGKPLITWTIEEAKKSKLIDRLIVSSDAKKIMDIALKQNCEVPFKRPSRLSKDNVILSAVIIHAVNAMPKEYDYVIALQCTSAFRTAKHIDEAIAFCIENKASSCISVCESKSSPYQMHRVDDKGILHPVLKSDKMFLPRQELPIIYELNGALYMIKIKKLLKAKSLLLNDTLAYIMDEASSLDIDTFDDFIAAESIMRSQKK